LADAQASEFSRMLSGHLDDIEHGLNIYGAALCQIYTRIATVLFTLILIISIISRSCSLCVARKTFNLLVADLKSVISRRIVRLVMLSINILASVLEKQPMVS
jgi:hypothetical protein